MNCPTDFKYMSGGFPPNEKCVYQSDNTFSVDVNTLPITKGPGDERPYIREFVRVTGEIERIRKAVREKEQRQSALNSYQQEKQVRGVQYKTLQSEFATVSTARATADAIRETNTTLKQLRPPTAPAEDIERERQSIQQIVSRRLLLLQIVLALLVVSLVAYLVLPVTYAHGLVFLLLCVGIAVGIFLEK